MNKTDTVRILESMKNEQNANRINTCINKINAMNDGEWTEFVKANGINSEEVLRAQVKSAINKKEQKTTEFKPLNDLISYGVDDTTLHIHLIPKDAHEFLNRQGLIHAEQGLIDALEKIKEMLKNNESLQNIDNVCAVSGIIHGMSARMFRGLGFNVDVIEMEQAKDRPELRKFYEMFKGSSRLGIANISKQALLSEEWEKLKETRKGELDRKRTILSHRSSEPDTDDNR